MTRTVDLGTIFPAEDFRLKMRFERGSPAVFFRGSNDVGEVLTERRHWLSKEPETCTAMPPEGGPLLEELLDLAVEWETLPAGMDLNAIKRLPPIEQARWLCEHWETDFLLTRPGADGIFRLKGGGVCFPSHWDLNSKINCTIAEIHAPVPGLNESLGRTIDGFMGKILPGISWERHNWGLSRSPELNQHPARNLPRLDESVSLEEVWWRLEDQSLVALPKSGGVLFGIRVTVHPLSQVKAHPAARAGLLQALETMPEDMARYKGFGRARGRIIELLAGR